jgi:hypothetical protein
MAQRALMVIKRLIQTQFAQVDGFNASDPVTPTSRKTSHVERVHVDKRRAAKRPRQPIDQSQEMQCCILSAATFL